MSDTATATDKSIATGVFASVSGDAIELTFPGTDYRVRLLVDRQPETPVGKRVSGVIAAQARRIDTIKAGGRYVEPVVGRPRRVQGRVVVVDEAKNALVVAAGFPIVCAVNTLQRAADFETGQMVSMDVEPGAAFTPCATA